MSIAIQSDRNIATSMGQPAFAMERVRVLERGDKLLVMDRISGRWTYLPRDQENLLRLWAAEDAPTRQAALAPYVEALGKSMRDTGIGIPGSERTFTNFNTLILKLTNACNLACSYCYDFEQFDKARRMEEAIALKAVSQAISLSKGRLWIILHGGEPMLVWPMIETLVLSAEAEAREKGVAIEFTGQTNMTRLTERIVTFSRAHNIAWGVSLDGTAEVHDLHRRGHDGRGSFALFLKALAEYPDFVRSASVMSTITAGNQSTLLDSARYFRDLGMAAWDWSLFQAIGRGRSRTTFDIDAAGLVASWNSLFDAVVAGEFDGFAVQPVKKYISNFFYGPDRNMCMRPQCGAGRDLLSISTDGTIEACDCIDPKGPLANLGNITREGLAVAIASPKADHIRSRNLSDTACAKCIWYAVCGGTCLAHAGAVDAVDPVACEVALSAFDRISATLAQGDGLQRYMRSLA
jgi:uncharacterized protein